MGDISTGVLCQTMRGVGFLCGKSMDEAGRWVLVTAGRKRKGYIRLLAPSLLEQRHSLLRLEADSHRIRASTITLHHARQA